MVGEEEGAGRRMHKCAPLCSGAYLIRLREAEPFNHRHGLGRIRDHEICSNYCLCYCLHRQTNSRRVKGGKYVYGDELKARYKKQWNILKSAT